MTETDHRDEFALMFDRAAQQIDIEVAKIRVAEAIHQSMELQGVTKAELAKRLRSSRAYVTKILQGTANLTVESLARISDCLNCRLEIHMNAIIKTTVRGHFSPKALQLGLFSNLYVLKLEQGRLERQNLNDDISVAA